MTIVTQSASRRMTKKSIAVHSSRIWKCFLIDKLRKFERIIIYALIIMMVFVVVMSTIRLGWKIVEEMQQPPKYLLNVDQLFIIFGFFLMILIGLELLESLRAYITED